MNEKRRSGAVTPAAQRRPETARNLTAPPSKGHRSEALLAGVPRPVYNATVSLVRRLLIATALPARLLGAQTPCATAPGTLGPSRDLYCIELFPGAAADSARGTVQLDWIPGPFTVAVAADGTHRWAFTLALAGLPDSLLRTPRAGFVAWAAPPAMTPLTRLGVVANGTRTVGPAGLDRFLVLVSAEPDTTARDRHGPIVLRGESAGMRLRPADVYQFFLGAVPPEGGNRQPATEAHAMHGATARPDSSGWTGVPMYPGLDMLPSEMRLRPPERAWLPPDDPAAPAARPRQVMRLAGGDTLDLVAGVVRRTLAGRSYTMFGFNGQYPGPLLMVERGARLTVRFANRLPQPSTVHWHGVRLDNRFDGVPGLTQPEVAPGGSFTYQLVFPDAGIYWYHPHVREDIQQDLGLYGNIFVRGPRVPAAGAPHHEEFLILDDILVGDAGLVPYGAGSPTHAAMGRFGNVYLVNGEPRWRLAVNRGAVVRFYLTNASATRTFNLSFGDGVRLKLIGSDLGEYRHSEWVSSVVIAPAERYVVEARFEQAGTVALLNRVHALDHLYGKFVAVSDTLGTVAVGSARAAPDRAAAFARPNRNAAAAAEQDSLLARAANAPRRTLELRVQFTGLPFVTERLMRLDSIYFNPVEWDGTMPGMNWATTGRQARWMLRDPASGAENMDVRWRFRRGDVVRLTLAGARDVLHGMQHPIHVHGQRFLVLAVNGVPNQNQVWKDTALIPAGGTVELLVELTNPGRWMVHCHIAEHLASGMMMAFDVEDR